jgi:hypothetical protein
MSLLISLLIFLIVIGIVYWIITLLPIPAQIKQIAIVVLALFALIYLLMMLFGAAPPLFKHF